MAITHIMLGLIRFTRKLKVHLMIVKYQDTPTIATLRQSKGRKTMNFSNDLTERYLEYVQIKCGVRYPKEEAQVHLQSLANLFSAFAVQDK